MVWDVAQIVSLGGENIAAARCLTCDEKPAGRPCFTDHRANLRLLVTPVGRPAVPRSQFRPIVITLQDDVGNAADCIGSVQSTRAIQDRKSTRLNSSH